MCDPPLRAEWLGHYSDGGDSWEDGARSIRFTAAERGIRFDWRCRYENNHGYDQSSAWGRVIAVSDTAISVELAEQDSSSWEDMFKEHVENHDTTPERVEIAIVEVADGRPVLRYRDAVFRFDD